MQSNHVQTIQLQPRVDGTSFLPLPKTNNINIFDYVLVKIKTNHSIIVQKYEHPEKFIPNTFLNETQYITFINYDPQYLRQQAHRKKILSHHY